MKHIKKNQKKEKKKHGKNKEKLMIIMKHIKNKIEKTMNKIHGKTNKN